ncbi:MULTISPECIES: GMP/IMP nucleotidase [Gammaproteobacteria]|uniref:GMP/IMP nucleotidase n=1 Tax=Gammaproteobacteria TaxID=1236 RepID=UPI000DD0D117|nr:MULTISPECIES: GMP/IMP nucleotidase [Gammaproteobacteria]RTE86444.1 GMP/IMP nucleotidase [Aliidiomarina sp. B3213]TCZ91001.1 GMP/IMP nucleotidase [Lysobacter sp. N42]
MLNWQNIDTILLDMDGTILDLHYDNYFWVDYLPLAYAKHHNIDHGEAQEFLNKAFTEVAGTLNWYCLDYWERTLSLPVRQLKREMTEKIKYRPDAMNFLKQLKASNKQVALLTNAHPDALALKNEFTHLKEWIPQQFSTHEFGYCKEFNELWQGLSETLSFNPKRTLFVDDGEHILDSAKRFGIEYTLGITKPDSQQPAKTFARHPAVASFAELPKLGE